MSENRPIHNAGKDRGPTIKPVDTSDERSDSSEPYLVALRHHSAIWLVPAVVLVIAVLPLPYGFYIFLRLGIFLVAVYLGYTQWKHDDSFSVWVITLGAVALLYNPIFPVHFARELWVIFNLLAAAVFLAHLRYIRRFLNTQSRDYSRKKSGESIASSSFREATSDCKPRRRANLPRAVED